VPLDGIAETAARLSGGKGRAVIRSAGPFLGLCNWWEFIVLLNIEGRGDWSKMSNEGWQWRLLVKMAVGCFPL
jgi:hypothetical protein